jgi:hypothetical protein
MLAYSAIFENVEEFLLLATSSHSIVSDYRLDGRGWIPSRGKGFSSSLCVQTGSEAHLAYPMGTGGPFPRGEARPGRDADHSPSSSAEVKV